MIVRPAPTAKVDLGPLVTPVQRVAVQVSAMTKRLDRLERHLADLQVLDEQLATPTPDASPNPTDSGTPVAGTTGKAPASGSKEVMEHLVKSGDTLSIIAEEYYGSAGPSLVGALAKYNKLRGNEIFPGDTLKIPARDSLP